MSTQDRLLGPGPEDPAAGEENLLRRAGKMAGWAARTGYSLGRRLPGVDAAERGLRQVERTALGELRRRLDQVDDPYLAALSAASTHRGNGHTQAERGSGVGAIAVVPARDDAPLRTAMAELLNRSVGFDREQAREYLWAVLLRQLTPDEARILAALADGSAFPLIDVTERSGIGGEGRMLLRNASTVGKASGVALLELVPAYVTRLIGLGLAEVGEEAPALDTQYEILMTEDLVRAAENSVKRARITRRTVHISRLGAQFWHACDPTG